MQESQTVNVKVAPKEQPTEQPEAAQVENVDINTAPTELLERAGYKMHEELLAHRARANVLSQQLNIVRAELEQRHKPVSPILKPETPKPTTDGK